MVTKKFQFVIMLVAITAFTAACAGTPTAPPAPLAPTQNPHPTAATQATSAPAAPLEKVSLAYGVPLPIMGNLPFDVAVALDSFKQEGLDVSVSYQPRINAYNALLAGSVDFAGLAIDQPILAQAQGKDLKMILASGRYPGSALVVRSDMKDKIKTIADLKGQKINYGGSPGVMPYVIAKAGLKSDDVQWVEDGRNIGQIESDMEKGVGVAGILGDPYTTQLVKTGKAFALIDLAIESDSQKWVGGEYPGGLVTTSDTLKNRQQTAQKMTNALVKAARYIATHTPSEIASILPESVTGKDKALFVEALQHSMPIFSKDGMVNEAGVKNAIDINKALGAIKPDAQINASALYTNDFVRNVPASTDQLSSLAKGIPESQIPAGAIQLLNKISVVKEFQNALNNKNIESAMVFVADNAVFQVPAPVAKTYTGKAEVRNWVQSVIDIDGYSEASNFAANGDVITWDVVGKNKDGATPPRSGEAIVRGNKIINFTFSQK